MNKLMKFCGKCEEAFADRFAFCPNCGGELATYEMNPITADPSAMVSETPAPQAETVATPVILAEAAAKDPDVLEIPEFESAPAATNGGSDPIQPVLPVQMSEPVATAPVFVSEARHEVPPPPAEIKDGWREVKSKSLVPADDGMYHITMVENKTVFNDPRLRATGIFALILVLSLSLGSFLFDMFNKALLVLGPDDSDLVYAVAPPDDTVADIVKEDIPKDNKKDDGGGGGGGGRKDPNPASEGRMAPMFKDPPLLTPSKEDISVSDPTLAVWRANQANKDYIPTNDGRPMGAGMSKIASDGSGGPLGQGNGNGNGQGPGSGPGFGPGSGGGMGGGNGGGFGPGNGPGDGGDPPELPKGPTIGVVMHTQPKPPYTEEARKNQISGTVVLKVTFNSNGTIGSITPVRGLGFGLTEQAIAAARKISFEPAKRGGSPITISKSVQYTFTLY